jgi:hypothetical protein
MSNSAQYVVSNVFYMLNFWDVCVTSNGDGKDCTLVFANLAGLANQLLQMEEMNEKARLEGVIDPYTNIKVKSEWLVGRYKSRHEARNCTVTRVSYFTTTGEHREFYFLGEQAAVEHMASVFSATCDLDSYAKPDPVNSGLSVKILNTVGVPSVRKRDQFDSPTLNDVMRAAMNQEEK